MSRDFDDHIEKALTSLDNMERAAPRPFLLTRVNAAIAAQRADAPWIKVATILRRPAVAFALLLLLLTANVAVFSLRDSRPDKINIANRGTTADDYAMNVSAFYDTENPEP